MKQDSLPTTQILEVATATPESRFSQQEMLQRFGVMTPQAQRFFLHPHIETRHVVLPPMDRATGTLKEESTGELLEKFRANSVKIGMSAAKSALQRLALSANQIDYICCVTSTGFIVPGLSTLLSLELGLRPDCQRLDIVGMGCHAGLNGLNAVDAWCKSNPEKNALLICVEICSAIYAVDESENTALVNSLFGDGAAAAILRCDSKPKSLKPEILRFSSHLIPGTTSALRFDYDDEKHRYRFHVGKETPKLLAESISSPVMSLLNQFSLKRSNVNHWIFHSGGAAILDGIEKRLELEPHDLRHTRSVLKDFGNLSSGGFLFSYERLKDEGKIKTGELGVMVTMGPGLTIETALLRWR